MNWYCISQQPKANHTVWINSEDVLNEARLGDTLHTENEIRGKGKVNTLTNVCLIHGGKKCSEYILLFSQNLGKKCMCLVYSLHLKYI